MAHLIDETHDAARRSFVASADGHAEFPIQNLPFGIFSPQGAAPRGGVAIGDEIFDLSAALEAGLFSGEAKRAAEAAAGSSLNAFLALGAGPRAALRRRISMLLDADGGARAEIEGLAPRLLHHASDCTLHLPAVIGDYTDFYAGIHHATTVGKLFRPDNPLLPNYKYVPIGYHGRASSVRPSGTSFHRPQGQRKRPEETGPSFGACRNLDFELELGIWIGPGNDLGAPIAIDAAADHIAGFCLLNDWSARDIQAFEYQPLGPFLAKNFQTTISPWIVTPEALAPFRTAQPARPDGDPAPLPYLSHAADQAGGALALDLEVYLLTARMRSEGAAPYRLSQAAATNLYWTPAQLVAHHASGGCNLAPGDLLGTGTISAPTPEGLGSLLEMTKNGRELVQLPNGETRGFLEDGDEIIMRAYGRRPGYAAIGFGECRARVEPARA